MAESRFKVGDKVYDICRGSGIVTVIDDDSSNHYPVTVNFEFGGIREFTNTGLYHVNYSNPTLLTISEARAKGYDVPREKVTRTETLYRKVLEDGTLAMTCRLRDNLVALGINPDDRTEYAVAVTTWETEV